MNKMPKGGHGLQDTSPEPSIKRQTELLREQLATLSELPDGDDRKRPAIDALLARIAVLEADSPEARPN